jgi:hypothetical protein
LSGIVRSGLAGAALLAAVVGAIVLPTLIVGREGTFADAPVAVPPSVARTVVQAGVASERTSPHGVVVRARVPAASPRPKASAPFHPTPARASAPARPSAPSRPVTTPPAKPAPVPATPAAPTPAPTPTPAPAPVLAPDRTVLVTAPEPPDPPKGHVPDETPQGGAADESDRRPDKAEKDEEKAERKAEKDERSADRSVKGGRSEE